MQEAFFNFDNFKKSSMFAEAFYCVQNHFRKIFFDRNIQNYLLYIEFYRFCNSKKNNGRFTGINASRFRTNRGVTEALDTTTGETIMLKAFTIIVEEDYDAAVEEMQTLRSLGKIFRCFRNIYFSEHANIVRFITFIDKHIPAWAMCPMCLIAMENCAGGSLVQWLERMKASGRRTTPSEASVIAAQLISALSFCHVRDVGHFDLKPGNVFLMPDFLQVRLYKAWKLSP